MSLVALAQSCALLTFLLLQQVEQSGTTPSMPVPPHEATNSAATSVDSAGSSLKPPAELSSVSPASTEGDVTAPSPALLLVPHSPLASAHEFSAVIVLLVGLWYTGWLFAHAALVLLHPSGSTAGGGAADCGVARLLFVIFVTAGGENGGMFLGRAFGRAKFTPRISPNKSREGALAQLLTSALVAGLFAAYADIGVSVLTASAWGLLLGFVATLGDLFESLLKRSIGVKDLGAIIPGAGGMMDRMDGLLFAFPTFYYLLQHHSSSTVTAT